MLKQRIITALVLLAVLLPALFARASWPFAVVTLALMAAAGWEWGRLNGAPPALAWGMGLAVAAVGAAALALGWAVQAPIALWWAAGAIWVVGGALTLSSGPTRWPHLPRALRWAIGVLALWVAWLAVAQARSTGLNFVLSIFALVWAADIAAYAGGRAFGKRKLAPTISPGKSWEGALTGTLAVIVLAAAWMSIDERAAVDSASVFTRLWQVHGTGLALAAVIGLAAMSVVGDLVESLVKRAAGAKDSSQLLPGHGGVLDRVDALLPVFPLALALSFL